MDFRTPSRASSLPQLDCVHLQKPGRLSGRLREQAHSYSWIAYICKKHVSCQAAFASRLTPTVGLRTSAKNRSAVRPPSRAGSLLQLDCVHLQKTGRLSGRLREQAHSYSWIAYICKKQVSCQAAFASKLAPTVGLRTSAENRSAVRPPSRAGSLLQLDCVHLQKTGQLSGRLREQARSQSWIAYICKNLVGCQAAFASRLTPTVELRTSAKNRSAVRPPSRASSLPQLDCVHLQKPGRLSGRLREQARPHSWIAYICKNLVGCQAAFASKLAPTFGLSTPAENRSDVGPLSRAGSLLQSDGVHLRKTGRLSGRLREQARSHSWIAYICKKQVGCQAAFASKLAPKVGLRTSAKTWSAVRPPSRAGSLLQLNCVHLQKTGRLSGRLREQARSYSWIAYICKNRSAIRPPSRASSLPQKSESRSLLLPTTQQDER